MTLIVETGAVIQIDPQMFTRLKINMAPTVAIVHKQKPRRSGVFA